MRSKKENDFVLAFVTREFYEENNHELTRAMENRKCTTVTALQHKENVASADREGSRGEDRGVKSPLQSFSLSTTDWG